MVRALKSLILIVWVLMVQSSAYGQVKVVATFTILQDWVREIGGDLCDVDSIVGVDGDPHIFEPTPRDRQKLIEADLVFMVGLGLEGWIPRMLESTDFKGQVVVLSHGIEPRRSAVGARGQKTAVDDPHLWMDPVLAGEMVQKMARALQRADPAHGAIYMHRLKAYGERLKNLHHWIQAALSTLDPAQRVVVTAHDAFGYFGDRYQVRFLAPQGLSTESEPSAKVLAGILKEMRRSGLKALFLENMTNPKLVEQIAQEVGTGALGTLYTDALSPADGPAPTYDRLMRHNVALLLAGMEQNAVKTIE